MSKRGPLVFYGWWIVLTGMFGIFLGPPITVFSFGVFFKSLIHEFHASRAAVSFAFTLHNAVGALWLPALGRLVDRSGARAIILASTGSYGIALLSALWLGHSIWQFYLFYSLLGIAVGGLGPVTYGAVMCHWFNRRRGLALGLIGSSIGIGAFAVPLVVQPLIAKFGWRVAYAVFGCAVLLIVVPVVAAFLQNDPAERGLEADGAEVAQPCLRTASFPLGLCWREIWHSPAFFLMICIFILTGASLHAGILHMPMLLTDRAMSPERAAHASSLIGIALIVGRLGSGYLLDRFFAPYVGMAFFGGSVTGLAILWTGQTGGVALGAAFLVGLGMGAETDLMAYLISRYFGLRALATAYGYLFAAFMLAGALGTLLMGVGFDHFHSYTVPLAGFCVATLCAVGLLVRLGPYSYGIESQQTLPVDPLQPAASA